MLHPRLRTFTQWTGTTLCVLIAAAFVVSGWWIFIAQLGPPAVYVAAGGVWVLVADPFLNTIVFEQHAFDLSRWATLGHGTRWIEFPLLLLFAAVAIPTLLVRRFCPKPVKPGHCRCGYDLTGNTSGVCPECAVEVQA